MENINYFIKKLMCMLVATTFLFISLSSTFQQSSIAESNTLPSIFVEKLVWNGVSYVESTEVNEGDIVQFNVEIYNPYDNYEIHWSGTIFDQLPCNLRYINHSVSGLPLEYDHPPDDPEYYDIFSNIVLWQVDRESPILPHQYLNFTYQALAVCCGSNYLENILTVSPSELINVCDPSDIINNNGSLDVSDSASVKVICEEPSIEIIKNVNNDGLWMDSTTVYEGEDVEFRLIIHNNGLVNLTSIQVIDTLPSILTYNYDANITPVSANDHQIIWEFSDLEIDESIEITFSAHADAVGEVDNICVVNTCQDVSDSDEAHIIVSGMIVEKKVWSKQSLSWVDEIDVSVGEIIRFRITVYYIGNGSYTLYNIRIRDELPECLDYENNANPTETAISNDGRIIWWNLSANVPAGGQISVEFDALVTETSGCGPCVNVANVSANECSGHFFIKEDIATFNAECPLSADAGGPYYGDIDEMIFIEGSASGGSPPYIYKWDLDNDGYFDDYSGQSMYYSWDEDDTFVLSLKVIDDDLRDDVDSTSVTIFPPDNQHPSSPSRPNGENDCLINEVYSYSTSTSDPDNDLIRYGWDWNGDDIVDEWTDFFDDSIVISISHSWTIQGIYNIKVKAEDEHGEQSIFSSSLQIIVSDASAPQKPSISGPSSGRIGMSYSYSSSTIDPDGDNIYYWFDWGDGTNSGWKGPYSSGQTVIESHTWNIQGSYSIKVRSKDDGGLESVWSDSLPITMPKMRFFNNDHFFVFLQWVVQFFPHFQFFFLF